MSVKRPIRGLALWTLLVAAGCGGGGGGSAGPVPQSDGGVPSPQFPGGGGGGASTPPNPDCISTVSGCLSPTEYDTSRKALEDEYEEEVDVGNQPALSTVRAERAWAQIELKHGTGTQPGSGITVGIIDSGIDTQHPVFAGKTITEEFLDGANDETGAFTSHGTAVASVIASRANDDSGIKNTSGRGIAWGADLAMFAIPMESSGPFRYVRTKPWQLGDKKWSATFHHVTGWSGGGRSLDFVNLSFGYRGMIEQYSEQELRTDFGTTIAELAQSGAAEKTVFVWAAGNSHGDYCLPDDFTANPDLCAGNQVVAKSPTVLAGLPVWIAELRGHSIAVVAVDDSRKTNEQSMIASFSNRCGIAAEWCLAAPGVEITAAYFGPNPDTNAPGTRDSYKASGTSLSAPLVTGGLVVMDHFFRGQVPNTDLVTRLLTTANRQGIYADRAIYGRGLMDLAAATSPVGSTTLSLGATVESGGGDLTATGIRLGRAFGDGLQRSLAGQEIAAFDSLGAPFWFELDSFVSIDDGPSPAARLHDLMAEPPSLWHTPRGPVAFVPDGTGGTDAPDLGDARMRLGFLDIPAGIEESHLSLARNAITLSLDGHHRITGTVFTTAGFAGPAPVTGFSFAHRSPLPAPGGSMGLRAGWIAESETLLGTAPSGAFGTLAANAVFGGIETELEAGSWHLAARAEIGTTLPLPDGGIFTDMSPIATTAFKLAGTRQLASGDSMTIALSQPLRVEGGRASLSVPVGRTLDGTILHSVLSADLTPSGREIDLSAEWRRPLAAGGAVLAGVGVTRHPGHVAHARPSAHLLAGLRMPLTL